MQPMSFFAQTCPRRRTAIVVLGAWVLALLVGIANACALGWSDSSHGSSERQATFTGHDHNTHASTGTEQAGETDGPRPLKPACQHSRNDKATTVVKLDKTFKVVPMATSAAAVVWWLPASAAPPLQARLDAAPTPAAPLAVRFMRLTI